MMIIIDFSNQIWSSGVISTGENEPVNPDSDLITANVTGFVPFFEKIDLGQPNGNVFVHGSTEESYLIQATDSIRNRSQSFGFEAKYVLTVTFQNVSSPKGTVSFFGNL